jgi:hypothetical protein
MCKLENTVQSDLYAVDARDCVVRTFYIRVVRTFYNSINIHKNRSLF